MREIKQFKEVPMEAHNLVNGKRVVVTHGELWLQPVDESAPATAKEFNSYIIGHSETGHNHVLEAAKGTTFRVNPNEGLTIFLDHLASVVHKKSFDVHETRVLAPGAYRVFTKTEYNPITKVIQRVFD